MPDGIHAVVIGDIQCTIVQDVSSKPDLDIMYDRFPSVEREAMAVVFNRLHPEGTCDFSMNTLLIQIGGHTVLVDTGTGEGLTNPRVASLVDPGDVDTVIISHGHTDHIGGLIDTEGTLVYPNARYAIHPAEWEYWTRPGGGAEARPEHVPFFRARLGAIKDKLIFVEDGQEIVPGVTARLTPGHTVGHLTLRIERGGDTLLFLADLLNFDVQLERPDWGPRFDGDPALAAKTRRALLERIADDRTLITFYHLKFPGLGYVIRKGDAFGWEPI